MGKNGVSVFSQSPLIRSLSNLQITRTGIKSRMSSNSDFSLRSYSPLSVPIDFEWGKWCLHLFPITMNSVVIKLTGNEDRHKFSDKFEFRSYLTSHFGVTCPWAVKKNISPAFLSHLWLDLCHLTCNEDRHKSSNEFEFGPYRIIHFGVIRPWARIFFRIDL